MNKEKRIKFLRSEIDKIITKYVKQESELAVVGRSSSFLRCKAVNKVNELSNEIAYLGKK